MQFYKMSQRRGEVNNAENPSNFLRIFFRIFAYSEFPKMFVNELNSLLLIISSETIL